ncbi:hypothetical protein [Bacillus sp. SD088]|uniref:hypothetical protein n=1 Tax=Bacillus sp. SD088 TaxID=2782012 RepID=UPI001A958FE7|nr:hypothetical protein [Bacillus sp. SD088]MBO0994067.1 hypothetical protein [Bacillus sp. SD088]
MKLPPQHPKKRFFMCNPKTATEEYPTQLAFSIKIEEIACERPKRKLAPVFRPYNNRQSFVILDVESLIPEHHVARVDSMIEAIPDEQLFVHYPGDGAVPPSENDAQGYHSFAKL